jgi:RNA polymerase sigma factor (sigma-70 family)
MGRADRGRPISVDFLLREAQASAGDDTWAMGEIVRRFRPLARRLVGEAGADPAFRDDLENAAYAALVVAVRRHDLGRQGFPGFAGLYMRGAVSREHRYLRRFAAGGGTPPLIESLRDPEDVELTVMERFAPWGSGVLAQAISGLSADQRRLAHRRYVEDAPLDAMAAEAGTSGSAVSQRLRTIHRTAEEALAA